MADITITGAGPNDNVEAQVDQSYQALRVSLRPLEFNMQGQVGGHFAMAVTFSNTAGGPAAASQLFSMRWAETKFLYVLKRVMASAATTTAFTTAQAVDLDIIKATSFSVGASGGTAITLPTTSNKARSATMSGSILGTNGNMQISSGGALTAGTQTLDNQPFGYAAVLGSTALATIGQPVPLFQQVDAGSHPMIFAANEGYVIRNGIALGAAGVVKFGFVIEWVEAPAY